VATGSTRDDVRKSRNGRGLASMSMSMGMGLGMAFADGRFSGGGSRSVLHVIPLLLLFDHLQHSHSP
jgi:hypothetical protein